MQRPLCFVTCFYFLSFFISKNAMMTILGLTAKKCAMKRARRVIKLTVCVKMGAFLAGKGCIVNKVKKKHHRTYWNLWNMIIKNYAIKCKFPNSEFNRISQKNRYQYYSNLICIPLIKLLVKSRKLGSDMKPYVWSFFVVGESIKQNKMYSQ